jgi:hypothetical protein
MTGGLSRRQLLKLGALAPAAVALSGLHLPAAAAATTPARPGVLASRKKGVGVAHSKPKPGSTTPPLTPQQCADRVQSMRPDWYYTWSPTGFDEVQGVEFVPMVWGGWPKTVQKQVGEVAALGPGERPVVLGFNEPDNPGQSDMQVDWALDLWPQVSALADLAVAPAPTHPFDDWATQFFQGAAGRGLKLDYFALHVYPGGNAQGDLLTPRQAAAEFLSTVDQVYATYGLPIWITEFALADWGANAYGGGSSRYQQDEVLEFMQAVLPKLEMWPHVVRYAWFGAGPLAANSPALGPSALFDLEGNVTAPGEFYAAFQAPVPGAAGAPTRADALQR